MTAAVLQEDAPRKMTARIPRDTEFADAFTAFPEVAGIAEAEGATR